MYLNPGLFLYKEHRLARVSIYVVAIAQALFLSVMMVKKIFAASVIFTGFNGYTQPLSPIYLTGHAFEQGQGAIGKIKLREATGRLSSLSLSGPQDAAFSLGKANTLRLNTLLLPDTLQEATIIVNGRTDAGSFSDTMRLLRDQFIANGVIAHRGAWKNTKVPENSIAALQHAVALGCGGSEFDVHQSSDGVPFINHDADIQGIEIARTPAAQLAAIKLPNGEALPTLEAYLTEGMKQHQTKLILEIKPSSLGKEASILLAKRTVALVEKLGAEAWVDYISFDYDVCLEVMRLAPYAKVAYLEGNKRPKALARKNFYGIDYKYSKLEENPTWIREAKRNGLTVNVWTVNDEARMKNLLAQDVDFITTNEPELLLKLVKDKSLMANTTMQ